MNFHQQISRFKKRQDGSRLLIYMDSMHAFQQRQIFTFQDCDSCCRGFEPHQPPQYLYALATHRSLRRFLLSVHTKLLHYESQC